MRNDFVHTPLSTTMYSFVQLSKLRQHRVEECFHYVTLQHMIPTRVLSFESIMFKTPCHRAIVPSCHRATVAPCHRATVSPCHRATVPPCHRATVPPCHRATVPPCHRATVPPCHRATVPPCHRATALHENT